MGNGHRARDPRPARDPLEDLLGRGDGLRGGAELPGLRDRPRDAGRATGAQRRGRAYGRAVRHCDRRRRRAPLGVRPQELLLPRPPKGLPDQPVRGSHRRARRGRDHARRRQRQARRRDACPPRGGRRQVAARGLPRHDGDRPQSRRHAAARDRLGTGHALCEGGHRLREEDPPDRPLPRHLRRQHAGGLVPGRRQRVGPTPGRGEARDAHRAQEPQLLPLPRAGDRVRGGPPDRRDRVRRRRGAGDAPVRPGAGRDALDAVEGRGERLPLLPRPGPAAGRADRGRHRRDRRRHAGAARCAAGALPRALRPVGVRRRRAHGEPRDGGLLRDRGDRLRRRQARRELGDGRAVGRAEPRGEGRSSTVPLPRPISSGCCAACSTRPSRASSPRRSSRRCGPARAAPTRSSRRAASSRSRTARRSRRSSTQIVAAHPSGGGAAQGRQGQADGLLRRPGDEGHPGQGQPGAGQPAAAQEVARYGLVSAIVRARTRAGPPAGGKTHVAEGGASPRLWERRPAAIFGPRAWARPQGSWPKTCRRAPPGARPDSRASRYPVALAALAERADVERHPVEQPLP